LATALAPGMPPSGPSGFFMWAKAVMDDDALRGIALSTARKPGGFDIRSVAFAIALHGASGRGCFATAETVAGKVGCSRSTAEKYRKQLDELGWFAVVDRHGGNNRRSTVRDIRLPVPEGTPLCASSACAALGLYALLWRPRERDCVMTPGGLLSEGRRLRNLRVRTTSQCFTSQCLSGTDLVTT
jgi:hypothetical protein